MKHTSYLKVFLPTLLLCLAVVVAACQEPEADPAEGEAATTEKASPEANVVKVIAADYAFGAPEEIPFGWTTFRLDNEQAHEIHELDLTRLPEGVTYEDYVEEVLSAYETVTERLQAGEIDGTKEVYGMASQMTPDWTSDMEAVSGRGLVSPGRSAEKTLYLEPGTYAMDCWIKAPDGQLHLSKGMTRELTVTEEESGGSKPKTDIEVTVADGEIVADEELSPGDYTIAAHFEEQGGGYNTINLVRVEEDTDLAEIARWVDFYWEGGLLAPAPAEFFGGSSGSPDTAYFTVEDVEPGEYAWVVWTFEEELWETFAVE